MSKQGDHCIQYKQPGFIIAWAWEQKRLIENDQIVWECDDANSNQNIPYLVMNYELFVLFVPLQWMFDITNI